LIVPCAITAGATNAAASANIILRSMEASFGLHSDFL
jgi:hypothetical protein